MNILQVFLLMSVSGWIEYPSLEECGNANIFWNLVFAVQQPGKDFATREILLRVRHGWNLQ